MFLKVDSAYPEDQGGGKVRLDPDTMVKLRLNPGALVYIDGKRRTVAKVWRMMVNDWNQGKIRIDNYTRMNAGASIGDRVEVTPVPEDIEAEQVVLAPPEDLPRQLPINYNQAISRLIGFPVTKNDTISIQAGLPFMQPQLVPFRAIVVEPENAVIITKNTDIEFSEKPAVGFEGIRYISYEDIGGLKTELQRVRETIELPLRHPELFQKLGIDPPKGVLLYGPPGTGKTLIAKAVANESGAHFIPIAGPEVISKYYGESEQRLREIFEEAQDNAPSIIFIDELDSIAPRREDVTGEVERRVVAQLLTMMDGLEERGQVVVIGATNRVDAIDPALRRPGRFDREIEIGVPGEEDRLEILRIHTRGMPLEGEVRLLQKRSENSRAEKALDEIDAEITAFSSLIGEHRNLQAALEREAEKLDARIQGISATIKEGGLEKDIEIIEAEKETLRKKWKKLENKLGNSKKEEVKTLNKQKELEELQKKQTENLKTAKEDTTTLINDMEREREHFRKEMAGKTRGFVGADLAALAREGAMRALRRYLPRIELDKDEIPPEVMESMEVRFGDFLDAFREVNPSAMREVFIEVPHTSWDDVGGLDVEKEEVREAVEYPLTMRKRFDNLGIEPPKGVLLYGPPGTGKTLIAKAVANESGSNFIPVRGPQLLSKWVGESERAVREIFRKGRQVAPSIIFFDELDALARARGSGVDSRVIEGVTNQILTEMDGIQDMRGVVVMGATNRPDIIDPALLRAGRFDRLVYIPEPDTDARKKILDIHTKAIPLAGSFMEEVVSLTDGYDKASLENLVEGLGKSRTVKLEEIKGIPQSIAENLADSLSPSSRRRIITSLLLQSHLILEDPVRDSLLDQLAKDTNGYVGSDLELLCREAAMFAMREGSTAVSQKHFEQARDKVRPMMNDRLREQYNRIKQYFKGGLPVQVQPPEYQ